MSGRPIVFLSDFGLDDEFVGVCHGVLARIAPQVKVIDLSHGVPAQDVLRGAVTLADAVPFMPQDAVYLAVIDPGVGTARRPVAVSAASGALLVGPDNGLLSMACRALGGIAEVVELAVGPSASRTFHGRDVFAPAAARLASGTLLGEVGEQVDPATLTELEIPEPALGDGWLRATVLGIDRFGNVQLNARPEHLVAAGLGTAGWIQVGTARARRVATFAEAHPDELAMLVDSTGRLAAVRSDGAAAEVLGVRPWDELTLEASPLAPEAFA